MRYPHVSNPRSAMTLLEVLAALAIVALSVTLVQLSLDGVSIPWRLRAAAHQIEAEVRWAQAAATSRRTPAQVLYDVRDGSYGVRIQGDDAVRKVQRLPGGIVLESVTFATGIVVNYDVAAASAYADGTVDAHEVRLVAQDGSFINLRFNRLTGDVTAEEGMSYARRR